MIQLKYSKATDGEVHVDERNPNHVNDQHDDYSVAECEYRGDAKFIEVAMNKFEEAIQHLADANGLLGDMYRRENITPDIYHQDRIDFIKSLRK